MDNSLTPEERRNLDRIKDIITFKIRMKRTDFSILLNLATRLSAENSALTAANLVLEQKVAESERRAFVAEDRLLELLKITPEFDYPDSPLEQQLSAMKRERDAAVKDLKLMSNERKGQCYFCKNSYTSYQSVDEGSKMPVEDCDVDDCEDGDKWEWRGVSAAPDGAEGEGEQDA
jgi:hypothetical protein